jgi:hypothetical protein
MMAMFLRFLITLLSSLAARAQPGHSAFPVEGAHGTRFGRLKQYFFGKTAGYKKARLRESGSSSWFIMRFQRVMPAGAGPVIQTTESTVPRITIMTTKTGVLSQFPQSFWAANTM